MAKLFNPDHPLMITMAQITDCIFLSLFWLLGCIPVVTTGASCAALYDAMYHACRKGDKHSWQRFWRVYKENLKPGIVPSILFWAVLILGAWLLIQLWNRTAEGTMPMLLFSAAAFVGVFLVGILSVLFPLLSRFENSTAGLMKNTVLLAVSNAPRTLVLGFLNAAVAFCCIRLVFPLFFLPALASLIGSLFLEPMFRPYMPDEAPESS